jgi:glycosyltransferase involved in cell wall biosynthesis
MPGNEKTIIILTPGFAKDEADSTCIPTQQNFVRALNEIYPQLNVIILALDYPYSTKKYKWYNNTVISFNGRNKGGLSKFLLRRKVLSVLKEIHRSKNITGLLSFWYGECALIGRKVADKNGVKHICWIWGQDAKRTNKYARRLSPKADELAVLSDFLQDEFEKNFRIRPKYVVAPGINAKQYNNEVQQKDIDILAAGSLIPLKQYEIFVRVIVEIKKQLPGIKAMLIGDGPEKDKLEALIAMNELQSNIILAGELPHSEVLHTMQRAKIFLHPSSYEGFGIVCIEALCAGCHVISFCKPMKQDIVNWYITDSTEAMMEQTVRILRNPLTIYKKVVPFEINDTGKKMIQLFDK